VLGLSATDRAEGATGERLTVAGAGEGSFEVDVRTAAGAYNHVAPVVLDAGGGFEVADDDLAPDTTNYVRIKRQGVPGALESAPVAVLVDSSVTPASANKIRSLSLSRSGTTITLRWGLVAGDGKKTKVYARRVDSGTSYLLTPQALAAGVKSLALGEQALAGPCVEFYATRVGAAESGPTLPVRLPTTDPGLGLGGPGSGGCPDSPGLPPPADGGPRFANSYHVRDHLGNLRIVTADSGAVAIDEHGVAERHDYYPFGIEMRPSGPVGESSRRKFTGHERDEATGLDYMLARYHSPALGRFLSVDPGMDIQPEDPQSWNLYAYVRNNPVNASDPDGRVLEFSGDRGTNDELIGLLNTGLYGHRLELDSSGTATLVATGDVGPPSPAQRGLANLLSTVISDPGKTVIQVVNDNRQVALGDFSNGKVDVGDAAALAGHGPSGAIGALAHEIGEQYAKQVGGRTEYRTAHRAGVAAENAATGWVRTRERGALVLDLSNGDLSGTWKLTYECAERSVRVTISVVGGNVVEVTP